MEGTVYGQVLKTVGEDDEDAQPAVEKVGRFMVVVSGPRGVPKGEVLKEVFADEKYVPVEDMPAEADEDADVVPVAVVEVSAQALQRVS